MFRSHGLTRRFFDRLSTEGIVKRLPDDGQAERRNAPAMLED